MVGSEVRKSVEHVSVLVELRSDHVEVLGKSGLISAIDSIGTEVSILQHAGVFGRCEVWDVRNIVEWPRSCAILLKAPREENDGSTLLIAGFG